MPRLVSNRVGVDVAREGSTLHDDVNSVEIASVGRRGHASPCTLSLKAPKGPRQKDLLRKKNAERRGQAKLRMAESERRQEERQQTYELETMAQFDARPVGRPSQQDRLCGQDTSTEWVPKHKHGSGFASTDAAAMTIQKALQHQWKTCQKLFRHTPRIFAEERVAGRTVHEIDPIRDLPVVAPLVHVRYPLTLPQQTSSVSPQRLASCSSCSCSNEISHSCSSCASSSRSTCSDTTPRRSNEPSLLSQQTGCYPVHLTGSLLSGAQPLKDMVYAPEHQLMATKLQARVRGCHGRAKAVCQSVEKDREVEREARYELQEDAAVKIQMRARGMLIRNHLPRLLMEKRRRWQRKKHQHTDDVGNATHLIGFQGFESEISETGNEMGTWPQEFDFESRDQVQTLMNVEATQVLVNDRLRVFCGTWNMHAKKPRDDLRLWIRWHYYHIVAVGSEECVNSIAKSVVFTSKKSWEDQLKGTLGPEYVLVASHALTAIHNVVFVHTSVLPLLGNIQSDAVATGLGNQLGNKGGVGIAFTLGRTSFAFVNCHFEAHQRNVSKRNGNFHRIDSELKLIPATFTGLAQEEALIPLAFDRNKLPGLGRTSVNRFSVPAGAVDDALGSKRTVSDLFDRVFWYGDLNYRINGTRRMVDTLLRRNQYEVLYANDQLQREMKAGNVFPRFREGPLHFRPTYKFDTRSDVYDSSAKQRIPSWTDRVLYLSNDKVHDIELQSYRSQTSFWTSDHRPVCATFHVTLSSAVTNST